MEEEETKAYKVSKEKNTVTCYYCGRKGHYQKDCFKKLESMRNYNRESQNRSSTKKPVNFNKRNDFKKKVNKVYGKSSSSEDENEKHYAYSARYKLCGSNQVSWTVDSGATCHISNKKEILENYVEKNCGQITIADGSTQNSVGVGSITFKAEENIKYDTVTIKEIMYVPELDDNLLSVSKLDDEGLNISFNEGKCKIYDKDELILTANKINGLYKLNSPIVKNIDTINVTKLTDNNILWHRRFGHLHFEALFKMFNK